MLALGGSTNALVHLVALAREIQQLKEAARIDGCGPWGVFRHVTIPLLMPTTLLVMVLSVIRSTQGSFGVIYVIRANPGLYGFTNVTGQACGARWPNAVGRSLWWSATTHLHKKHRAIRKVYSTQSYHPKMKRKQNLICTRYNLHSNFIVLAGAT